MVSRVGLLAWVLGLGGCSLLPDEPEPVTETPYLSGANDALHILVWRSPELSMTIPVRPDGTITTPLVEDL